MAATHTTVIAFVRKQLAAYATKTDKAYALFDQFGLGNLTVDMARTVATAVGLNATSAEISFYRWQALRTAA